jgi:hypothetical protein
VIGSDIPVGGVRMIRVILVNAIELESVLTHPDFLYNPDFQENPEKKKHEDERYEVRCNVAYHGDSISEWRIPHRDRWDERTHRRRGIFACNSLNKRRVAVIRTPEANTYGIIP